MAADLSKIITVTVTPDGYFLQLPEDLGTLGLYDLVTYIVSLQIANINREAVTRAFQDHTTTPVHIATLPVTARPATPPVAPLLPAPAMRPVRWVKPYYPPSAPVRPAKGGVVVDTATVMAKTFEAAFKGAGFVLSHAGTPHGFVQILEHNIPPDLILLAARLGPIDGGVFAAKLRRTPKTAKVPVIMYSAARPRQEIIKLFDCGITDYFVMPMAPEFFRQKVQGILAQVKKFIPLPDAATASAKGSSGAAAGREEQTARPADGGITISLRDLINKVRDLLAVPHILERVMKISSDSVSGAKDLAQAIRTDPATVAMALRKVNSVFYGKSEPIKDVQEAIIRIGLTEIKTLVLSMSVINQFSKEQKSNGFSRNDFWLHSMATAVLARMFGRQLRLHDIEDLFIGGLLHDIGKIIFDEYANPPYDDIVMNAIRNRTALVTEERKTLSFTHVDVGRSLLQGWKFPEHLENIVARHHSPETRGNEQITERELLMIRLIYISNLMAKVLQAGSGGDLAIQELPLTPWVQSFTKLKLDKQTRDDFHKELAEMVEFLGIGSDWTKPPTEVGSMPHVILVDALQDARAVNVTQIHLESAGYGVASYLKAGEIKFMDDDKKQAACLLVDSFEKLSGVWDGLMQALGGKDMPTVFILPEMEKNIQQKMGTLERPDFLKENQTLLYEPYDVSELHQALEKSHE